MPLQNRKDFETTKLHGVNLSSDPTKLQMGWFTHLANWIPAQRLKLRKKRGVDDVPTGAFFEPEPCQSEVCTDLTVRGQQLITIETAFEQNTTFGGGNLRTSWGYIDGGEMYSLIGQATCGGGNMTYGNTCTQINHYTLDNPTLDEAILIPDVTGAGSFVNTRVGVSDVPVWAAVSNGYLGMRAYYDLGLTHVDYVTPATNFGGHDTTAFAIRDDEVWLYIPCCLDSGLALVQFAVYNRISGVKTNDYYSFGVASNVAVTNMQLTDSYLYCLGTLAGVKRVYKIDRTTGAVLDSIIVTALGTQFVCVANDDLIYLINAGAQASVCYIENFTDITFVGYAVGQGLTPFSLGTGLWKDGNIYYGSNGFAGFTTNVFKIAIECPDNGEDPLIASVTVSANVSPGGSVTVSWEDVLNPSATDTILMKPAPTAGTFGLTGTTIASFTNSSALSSGSTSVAVPGSTAPGNYVFMYASSGLLWTATSNILTVS